MSFILMFARKWFQRYRALRYGRAFWFAHSIQRGLWLARG